jgi:demethylmenaquinone methyltransferase/2-methoxy-6-polyprenyl-1,4-benzoquinol methylase
MRGHVADREPGGVPRAAPHPVLRQYYGSEGERQTFVRALFDRTAAHYDRVCGLGSLGSGRLYRRWALVQAGLRPGMTVLDVATGTGLVARAAARIVRQPGAVVGLDPSRGMLREARKTLPNPLVQGTVEALPFARGRFDFLSMGYALRHVADLDVAFRECLRVLKPGGRILILEITRPRSRAGQRFFRTYFARIVPRMTRIGTGSPEAELLMRYHWDTIAACVPPDAILGVMRASGFVEVERAVRGAFLSEYRGRKPAR